jgi:nucleobase:cation symporter-1, NCS1 family
VSEPVRRRERPRVEEYGVEPIPAELRTARWPTLFAINFTFFLNPVMCVLGAFAVLGGGLPLWWAVLATVVGQGLSFAFLVVVAQPGVDHGLQGQVAMRAHFGQVGARALTSPYRVVASVYWFGAQALTAAFGVQAIVEVLADTRLPVVPVALGFAVVQAALAVLGFDVMRWLFRVVLPLSLAASALLIVLYVATDDPRYGVSRVFHSPEQRFTWLGFATYVTVLCVANLTFVTNVADFCRYTPTRRDMRIGLVASALTVVALTTFLGGYVAVAAGETNPFVAVAEITSNPVVLVVLLLAIVVQTVAANITNVYTGGLSLVNALPALGRVRASILVGALAVVLSGFPDLIERAQEWITHLGNVAAPITGVILVDYLVRQRRRIDVAALFDPVGRYRYFGGVNVAALLAVGAGVAVYYAVPHEWLKVLWGVGVAGGVYTVLATVQERVRRPVTTASDRV